MVMTTWQQRLVVVVVVVDCWPSGGAKEYECSNDNETGDGGTAVIISSQPLSLSLILIIP